MSFDRVTENEPNFEVTPSEKVTKEETECSVTAFLTAAGLSGRFLLRDTADYDARIDSYWSKSLRQRPAVIVQPQNVKEVADTLAALVKAKQLFAIRSGGHLTWAESNNIQDGFTIDLGLLNTIEYHPETETVDIGTGCRWRDVYSQLEKHGRVVAGGREGGVGVGGLLLGGGMSFFNGRHGFSCDNVLSYEVVLASGTIVTASAREHSDLFRALKGGSSNFGIVTRFTMSAIPCGQIWAGTMMNSKEAVPGALESVEKFTASVGTDDPDANLIFMINYLPEFRDVVPLTALAHVGGVEKAPIYARTGLLDMPGQITSKIGLKSLPSFLAENLEGMPTDYHVVWFTACFRNDGRIIARAAAGHDTLVEALKGEVPDGNFITQCVLQPLPHAFVEASARKGGNVLGVDRQQEDGILLLASAMVPTAELEAFAYPRVKGWVEDVKEFASGIEGGNLEWTYLNYADKSQNPLGSYGEENVRLLREVAVKYDPDEVFQRLCPGGFKLKNVK